MPGTSISPITGRTRPRPTSGASTTTRSPASSTRLEAIAKTDGPARLRHAVARRAPFPARGLRGLPNILMLRGAPRACHETAQDRLRLQHRADVAPAAPRRGFRDRRHPDQGAHRVRRRARLSHPRGRDLRRADARPERQPRTVRGAGRDHLQGVQQRALLAQGQALHAAAGGAVSRLSAQGADPGAAAGQHAGRMLAADRQRQPARARFHGQARHQGRGRRRRGDDAGRADPGLPARPRSAPAST